MRGAIRGHLALGPATRLLAFATDAIEAADVVAIAHLAVCRATPWPDDGTSCAVAVDPLRLPFVEALFDTVLVAAALEASDAPAALLREVRRVIAPAGTVVVVVPRRRLSFAHAEPGRHYSRARLERLLVEAMLEPLDWQTFGGVHLVRACPCDGLAPMPVGRRRTAVRAARA